MQSRILGARIGEDEALRVPGSNPLQTFQPAHTMLC